MKFFLKLAWRNIWRNKRRSALSLSAIVFATMVSIAMRGFQKGTYAVNIRYTAKLFTGFLEIQKEGYRDNPSLQKSFRLNGSLKKILDSNPKIIGYAPRITGNGLISFKNSSQGAIIIGINPKAEKKTSTFLKRIKRGKFFNNKNGYEVVIDTKLLENLGAKIGDTVVVLAQGLDGSMGNLKFKISGTILLGNPQMDEMALFMPIGTADELLAMYGKVNSIAINLPSLYDIPEVKEYIEARLQDKSLKVLDWSEVLPDLKQAIELDNIGGMLDLGILIVIVAFGILNTVLMSVTERFKEFGISLSIGMPQSKLVISVLLETSLLALSGILLGNILAYGINYYFMINPIHFSSELQKLYETYGFLPVMKSSVNFPIFFNSSLIILIASIIAAIYPAYKVYKLEPLKGIRYT